jgi:hypothetical protein
MRLQYDSQDIGGPYNFPKNIFKDANKYGDWPEAIEISGCVPHPSSIPKP